LASRAGQLVQLTNNAAIFESIADSEYAIRWNAGQGVYKSANRAQDLRFTYYQDGFELEPRDYGLGNPKPWEATLSLAAFGKTASPALTVANPRWISTAQNAANVAADGLTIEYTNSRAGMRQSFLLTTRPAGDGPLQFQFGVQAAGVGLRCSPAGDFVCFTNGSGQEAARYFDLHAWDALGNALQAQMVATAPQGFAITVNDSSAVYPVVVDPLMAVWGGSGTQTTEEYGYVVGDASDMLSFQPGTSGWIVGAPDYDNSGSPAAGAVFLYWFIGSGGYSWQYYGDQGYCSLGSSVACPLNVDGNTFGNVVVGAPGYSSGGLSGNGRVYVFAGSHSGPPASPTWHFDGSQTGEGYGQALCVIPLIQNRSYDGFAVGAPSYFGGESYGLVDIYTSTGTAPSLLQRLTPPLQGGYERFGWSVASRPTHQMSGYGAPPLLVGVPGLNQALFYPGGQSTFGNPVTLTGPSGGSFGWSVADVGDTYQVGTEDLLIGAPSTTYGNAYFYHGPITGSPQPTATLSAPVLESGSEFGWSVSGGPMVWANQPPYGLLVGAPKNSISIPSRTYNGAAFLYTLSSGTSGQWTLASTVIGGYSGDECGYSLAYIYNAQFYQSYGVSGVIVGAPWSHDINGNPVGGTVSVFQYSQ